LGDMCALFRDHGQRPIIVGLVANFLTWKKWGFWIILKIFYIFLYLEIMYKAIF
jgi:hypothetical protein